MEFVRQIAREVMMSRGGARCPEIWELDTGDVAVIGVDITKQVKGKLPKEIILGDNERIVVVPMKLLRSAKSKII